MGDKSPKNNAKSKKQKVVKQKAGEAAKVVEPEMIKRANGTR